jgi:hypothetical protein
MQYYDSYLRWLYRGGHPNAFARLQNRGSAIAFAAGIVPNRAGTLQIPGRRSGRVISFPVVIADFEGERYLVSMLGENANRVRNLKAAGGHAVLRHGRRQDVSRARRPRPGLAALPAGCPRRAAAYPGRPEGSSG